VSNPYLASTLLTALRDEGYLGSDENASSTRLLGILNRQQRTWLTKLLLSVREDYQLASVDVALTTGQTVVPVPTRAVGAALKLVSWLDNGVPVPLNPIASEKVHENSLLGGGGDYSMQGNNLVLSSAAPASSSLRIQYFRRMNKVVDETEAAEVASFSAGAKTVTLAGTVPDLFSLTSTTYDMVKGTPHFDTLAASVAATRVGQVLTFTDDLPDDLAVGDWVALEGQTPICQAPVELHDVLVFKACYRHLKSRGDPKADGMKDELDEMRADALSLLAPRVQGSSHVLINPNAPGWNRSRLRWRR
jgi:hypothetical protein